MLHVYVDRRRDSGVIVYVGQGDEKRIRNFKRNNHWNAIFKSVGIDRNVVFSSEDPLLISSEEIRLIALHHTWVEDPACNEGVNYTPGGEGGRGRKDSDETRFRKSISGKLAQNRPEVRAANSAAQKLAQNRPDVKERRRQVFIEYANRPDVKEKTSARFKGKKLSTKQIENMIEAQNRPEVKVLKSQALIEALADPDVRRQKSETMKAHQSSLTAEERSEIKRKAWETRRKSKA